MVPEGRREPKDSARKRPRANRDSPCWEVEEALYGLKQVAREWHVMNAFYECLKAYAQLLSELGSDRCHSDPSLFVGAVHAGSLSLQHLPVFCVTPVVRAGRGVLVMCLVCSHVHVQPSCCAVVATSELPLTVGRLLVRCALGPVCA